MRRPVVVLCCAALVLPVGSTGLARAAEPNIQPAVEKLSASSTGERIAGLRELGRLKPSAPKVRPVLEKMLNDPSPEVRSEVVWAVSDLLAINGLDLLQKLYTDQDRAVRDGAIRAICKMWDQKPARETCSKAYKDPKSDFSVRVEVLDTLRDGFTRDAAAGELFRAALKDPSEMVQRAGVFGVQSARDAKAIPDLVHLARTATDIVAEPATAEALATIGTPEAVQALIDLLPRGKGEPGKPARPTDRVRAAAARALDRIGDAKALPALRAQLADPSSTVRVAVLGALTTMKDKQAVPQIVPMLKDKEPRVRQMALRALRQIGDPSAADAVRAVLKDDKDVHVRAGAVTTLADLLGPKSIKDLEGLRDDLAPEVRLEAAADLAAFGKPAAPSLALFLKDGSADVRMRAIQGLGQIGGPEHIAAIAAAGGETGRAGVQVRLAIAEALGNIKHKDGLPALLKLAADPEPSVRQGAAQALGQVGGPEARKALDQLAKDQVAGVRNAARRALETSK